MIGLMTKGLPDTVIIGGSPFLLNTDFRVWMRFCNSFEKWDKREDLDISYLFRENIPAIETEEDMKAVLGFAYPTAVVPKGSGGNDDGRIIDYEIDADYLYSAFLGQYGIDLTDADLHWHKFRALLHGLNSSTKLHEIMGYRCYNGKDQEYIKLRNAWELPVELTEEDKKKKEEFDNYFG